MNPQKLSALHTSRIMVNFWNKWVKMGVKKWNKWVLLTLLIKHLSSMLERKFTSEIID